MERVIFFDPPAVKEPSSLVPSAGRVPLPAPLSRLPAAFPTLPSKGREREVQQLIHDLAVLAADHRRPFA